jgi:ribosomal protein S18 acetylase RimI-like enzyme
VSEAAAVTIERYQDADEAQVVALWEQCFAGNLDGHNEPHRSIQRKMAVQGELFFVARREGRIVGTTMAGYDGHRGWIYSVAVSPELRRSGIGRALLQHAETALAALGCPKINLQVRAGNEAVIGFYRSCGFVVEPNLSMGRRLL